MLNTTEYIESLETSLSVEEFNPVRRNELAATLETRALKLAFQHVLSECYQITSQLSSANMSTPEGIHAAVKVQGRIEGMQRAMGIIIECASGENELEPQGEHNGKEN